MGRLATVLKDHAVIAIDTNCFIYYLEEGLWAEELKEDLFRPLEEGLFRAVTSALTVGEILVRPKSLGKEDVCEEYNALLCSYPNLEISSFTVDTAVLCAAIRARHRIRTPDAIQLATALEKGATLFLTNDGGLPDQIGSVRVVVLKDLLSF